MHRILAFCAAAIFAFCAENAMAQEFAAWEGKPQVHEGQGGTRKTVDDIDFWTNGAPPRKFMLLGYITDRRHKTGIWGAISMGNLEADVAKVAKQAGGDAVILVSADAETTGYVGNAWNNPNGNHTWGSGAPVQKQNSKFAVVKYLPDDTLVTPLSP
jgi:hypothetical protein